jgi:hypothetical protein
MMFGATWSVPNAVPDEYSMGNTVYGRDIKAINRDAMSIITIAQPHILRFQGVFPAKYDFDAMMTKRIMDSLAEECGESDDYSVGLMTERTFDKVPTEFTGPAAWPMGTNLSCWQCKRTFKSRPFALVYDAANKGTMAATKMSTRGNVCSGDCAGTLLDATERDADTRFRIERLTCMFFRALTGRALTRLPRAPRYEELEQFGGNLTIDEFIEGLVAVVEPTH